MDNSDSSPSQPPDEANVSTGSTGDRGLITQIASSSTGSASALAASPQRGGTSPPSAKLSVNSTSGHAQLMNVNPLLASEERRGSQASSRRGSAFGSDTSELFNVDQDNIGNNSQQGNELLSFVGGPVAILPDRRRSSANPSSDHHNSSKRQSIASEHIMAAMPHRHRTDTHSSGPDFMDEIRGLQAMPIWRRKLKAIVDHKAFEAAVITCIILNAIALGAEDPTSPSDSTRNQAVQIIDSVFTFLFVVELAFRFAALGAFSYSFSYLRSPWNWFDTIIIVISAVVKIVELALDGSDITSLSSLRLFRVLRPLRLVSAATTLRILVNSVLLSLPYLSNVMLMYMVTLIIFGTLGVFIWESKLSTRCVWNEDQLQCFEPKCIAEQQVDSVYSEIVLFNHSFRVVDDRRYTCRQDSGNNFGRHCRFGTSCENVQNSFHNKRGFDNIGQSILTLFVAATFSAWYEVLYQCIDSTTSLSNIYFVLLALVCSYYIINLSLVIINYAFMLNVEAEILAGKHSLSKLSEELPTDDDDDDETGLSFTKGSKGSQEGDFKASQQGDFEDRRPSTASAAAESMMISMMIRNGGAPFNGENGSQGTASSVDESLTSPNEQRATVIEVVPGDQNAQGQPGSNPLASSESNNANAAQSPKTPKRKPKRSAPTRLDILRHRMRKVSRHRYFMYAVTLVIVVNTIVLMLDHHNAPETMVDVLDALNIAFTVLFSIESTFKMAAFGRRFFRDSFNVFDLVVVILSWIDVIFLSNIDSGVSAFRTFRLLRVIRLGETFKTLSVWITTLLHSIRDAWALTLLLAFITFVYALLGLSFFGGQMCEVLIPVTSNITEIRQIAEYDERCGFGRPRAHFDNILNSALTLFQVLTAEDWHEPMYNAMKATSDGASVFFVSYFIIGNYVLLNLFIAVMLSNREQMMFDDDFFTDFVRENEDEKKMIEANDEELEARRMRSSQHRMSLVEALGASSSSRRTSAVPVPEEKDEVEMKAVPQRGSDSSIEPHGESNSSQALKKDGAETPQPGQEEGEKKEMTFDGVEMAKSVAVDHDPSKHRALRNATSPTEGYPQKDKKDDDEKHKDEFAVDSGEDTEQNGDAANATPTEAEKPRRQRQRGIQFTEEPGGPNMNENSMSRDGNNASCSTESSGTAGIGGSVKASKAPSSSRRSKSTISVVTLRSDADDEDDEDDEKYMEPLEEEGEEWKADDLPWYKRIQRNRSSLFILSYESRIRRRLAWFVQHPYFEICSIVLIFLSCVALASEDPLQAPDHKQARILKVISIVFTSLFAVEAFIKIIAFGFILHRGAYLRDWWNVIDFAAVIISTVSDSGAANFSFLKVMRSARPLRFIAKSDGMKLVLLSLWNAIPSITYVGLILLLVLIIFGIMGVSFFKGKFYRCTETRFGDKDLTYQTKEACQTAQYYWVTFGSNFDHLGNAIVALFEVITFEGWVVLMYLGMDANTHEQAPTKNSQWWMSIYFVTFVIVGGFFVVNFFMAVLMDMYDKEKRRLEASTRIGVAKEELLWLGLHNVAIESVTRLKTITRVGELRMSIRRKALSKEFGAFMLLFVCLNAGVLMTEHRGQSDSTSETLDTLHFACQCIFLAEMLIQFVALNPAGYLVSHINKFEIVITIGVWAGIILQIGTDDRDNVFIHFLKILALGRLLRILRLVEGVRTLLATLSLSLNQIFHVAGLVLLHMFFFSVLGMNLFARVADGEQIGRRANFRNIRESALMLARIINGEAWDGIRRDCAVEELPLCNPDIGNCGSAWLSSVFFVIFMSTGMYILLNLFVAVIVNSFWDANSGAGRALTEYHMDEFNKEWLRLDPETDGMIRVVDIHELLTNCGAPLGYDITESSRQRRKFWWRIGKQLNEVCGYDGETFDTTRVHYFDLVPALIELSFPSHRIELETEKEEALYARWFHSFQTPFEDPLEIEEQSMLQTFAAILLQRAWRTALARHRKEVRRFDVDAFGDPVKSSAIDSFRKFTANSLKPTFSNRAEQVLATHQQTSGKELSQHSSVEAAPDASTISRPGKAASNGPPSVTTASIRQPSPPRIALESVMEASTIRQGRFARVVAQGSASQFDSNSDTSTPRNRHFTPNGTPRNHTIQASSPPASTLHANEDDMQVESIKSTSIQ